MVHLFIHNENQELLWNIINKCSLFYKTQTLNKEQWFRNCIQHFYDKIQNENIQINNKDELQELNKNVLTYMVTQLHQISQQYSGTQRPQSNLPLITPSIQQTSFISAQNYMGKEAERANKQEQFNSAFEERQKQYESLFSKPSLPEIDFSEKKDDGPISNMEELVQQHLKERENEIQKYLTINKILPENISNSENIIIKEFESSPNEPNINQNNTQNINI
jgi:hypothetical protein